MKIKITSIIAAASIALGICPSAVLPAQTVHAAAVAPRALEKLDRGLVVINSGAGMYLSWRLLGTEGYNTTYNVYRDGYLIANVSDSTNYSDKKGNSESVYCVAPVVNGAEGEKCAETKQWGGESNYMDIEIPVPAGGKITQNEIVNKKDTGKDYEQEYTYKINDMSAGDLDGDGQYELVVKFMPTNAGESLPSTYTANVKLGAYELDGTPLWKDAGGNTQYIDLGINVRANPHGPQFLVYDFNGDGIAEISTKTAQGTIDTAGKIIIENSAAPDYFELKNASDYDVTDRMTSALNHAGTNGQVLCGREYYTMFNGSSGAFIDSVAYHTPRTFGYYDTYNDKDRAELKYLWGDDFGNRSERYTDTVAYLDGVTPYAVEWRGYYHGESNLGRTAVGAYKLVGNELINAYTFDTAGSVREKYDAGTLSWDSIFGSTANAKKELITNNPDWNYCGNGNHNILSSDFDEDGCDEVVSGSLCLQLKDGKFGVKWNYNRGHGDAFHLGRYVKDGKLLYFIVHEDGRSGVSEKQIGETVTENDASATSATETKTTEEKITERIDDDHINFEVKTTTVNSSGTKVETKVIQRTYSNGALTGKGRGYGMSVIDPSADGAVVNGLAGEPSVLFFEDAGGDTGRGIMVKGCEGKFFIDSSGNNFREVTYDGSKPDDTDDSDGSVTKDGYTFSKVSDGSGGYRFTMAGIGKSGSASYNSRVYWDGDVYDELLDGFAGDTDGRMVLGNYNNGWYRVDEFEGTLMNNSTKNNPCLSADLFGDWREEIICRTATGVRIYTTNIPTNEKIYTLMHDSQYRNGVASEQAAYNQPPHVSWYMGEGMDMASDKPNITTVEKTAPVAPTATKTPDRTYTETPADILWQNNTELTSAVGGYTGYVLDTAYTGTLNIHASVLSSGAATFNLRDSNTNKLDGGSYLNMINTISFDGVGTVTMGGGGNTTLATGKYIQGEWYNIDCMIDTSAQKQTVTVSNAQTGEICFTVAAGFRQSASNLKRISFVSNNSAQAVSINDCAVYTGSIPVKGTITAADTVKAGASFTPSIEWLSAGNTAASKWTSSDNVTYTLYKDNLYTKADIELTASEGTVNVPRTAAVGNYILEAYDGIRGYAYKNIKITAPEPIKVTDDDIVLELNGVTGAAVASDIYTDSAMTKKVTKTELGIKNRSAVMSVLAKISDSCAAAPEYTVRDYSVTISKDGRELEKVKPTMFADNRNLCMSQFVDGVIAAGEYTVTVTMTVEQENIGEYTVSKSGNVTITESASFDEYFYTTSGGVNVTVFVR